MANRRMFSMDIVDTDIFLDMPHEAQNLYFHLGMRADDKGFISNSKKIQRMVNCSNDSFKILIAKKYILPFESGIIVIKDWNVNNQLRADRIKETNYLEEYSLLRKNSNLSYTIEAKNHIDNQVTTKCPHSIVKDSIVKDSIEENITPLNKSAKSEIVKALFEKFWNSYNKKVGKPKSLEYFKKLNIEEMNLAITKALLLADCTEKKFRKDPERWLRDKRFTDEIIKSENNSKPQGRKVNQTSYTGEEEESDF